MRCWGKREPVWGSRGNRKGVGYRSLSPSGFESCTDSKAPTRRWKGGGEGGAACCRRKSKGLALDHTWAQTQLGHFSAVVSLGVFTSMSLHFSICKMGLLIDFLQGCGGRVSEKPKLTLLAHSKHPMCVGIYWCLLAGWREFPSVTSREPGGEGHL